MDEMPNWLRCPFCGATRVKFVLAANGFLTDLDSFLCTACSNPWCVPSDSRSL